MGAGCAHPLLLPPPAEVRARAHQEGCRYPLAQQPASSLPGPIDLWPRWLPGAREAAGSLGALWSVPPVGLPGQASEPQLVLRVRTMVFTLSLILGARVHGYALTRVIILQGRSCFHRHWPPGGGHDHGGIPAEWEVSAVACLGAAGLDMKARNPGSRTGCVCCHLVLLLMCPELPFPVGRCPLVLPRC